MQADDLSLGQGYQPPANAGGTPPEPAAAQPPATPPVEAEKKDKKSRASKKADAGDQQKTDPSSPSVAIDEPAPEKTDGERQHDLIHHVGKH